MRRPGNLHGIEHIKPRNFGSLPPDIGPRIPGPPKPSLASPFSHPKPMSWLLVHGATGGGSLHRRRSQQNCSSCK